jgi:hypothetical protein
MMCAMRGVACVVLAAAIGCATGGGGPADAGIDARVITPPEDAGSGCTPENAASVCGSRPCVDGFCCDDACEGECRSCAVPGSEGVCTFHAASSDPDVECEDRAPATCGTSGMCNGFGGCELHPSGTSCDDGQACTSADVCDGMGGCRGDAPTECAPAAGNECCVGSCDASGGCLTTPGLCADQCGSNQLLLGRTCLGCGAARAAGACMGGGAHACDAASHTLCEQLTCGGVMYMCTNDGGTWAWRTAGACDDGDACTHTDACSAGRCGGTTVTCTSTACMTRMCNGTPTCTEMPNSGATCDDANPCTYSDRCSATGMCMGGGTAVCNDTACIDRSCNGTAACTEMIRTGNPCDDGSACTYGETCNSSGACGVGTTINCDVMDQLCRDFSCNGTATCASAARNVGMTCDDGNAMTMSDQCRADGSCAGYMGCALPADACANGSQSRDRCANSRIIGRRDAADADAFTITADTCSASNRFDDCSWDAGHDHAYRIWMRTGETMSARLSTSSATCVGSWQATLKLYESTGCTDITCSGDRWCHDHIDSAETHNYTAVRDGWIVLVVDGSTAFDDWGQYTLTVDLTSCLTAGCECP